MKKVAILQSNYIPWKGYFDLIAGVDEFIILDDVQFTKNDWRNRNQIKTPNGLEWLSVPTGQNISRTIREVELSQSFWQEKHWKTLQSNYARAPFFELLSEILLPLYVEEKHTNLSEMNRRFISRICDFLQIKTEITDSSQYTLVNGKVERVLSICEQAKAKIYVSGPSAKGYLREKPFAEKGITIEWFDYSNYPEYPQLWGDFKHEVSIIDLLFNCGPQSLKYMKAYCT